MRASFWLQVDSALAGDLFVQGHLSTADTWAKRSHLLLLRWGVMDWPVWAACKRGHCNYKTYVKETLFQASSVIRSEAYCSHRIPLPYCTLLVNSPHSLPHSLCYTAFAARLPWHCLTGHHALSRLRSGMVHLGHLAGKFSQARVRTCISCNKRYTGMYWHVVCNCPTYCTARTACANARLNPSSLQILATTPDHPGFSSIVHLAAEICRDADAFWK